MSPKSSSLRVAAAGGGRVRVGTRATRGAQRFSVSGRDPEVTKTAQGDREPGERPAGGTGGETGPRVNVRVSWHGRPGRRAATCGVQARARETRRSVPARMAKRRKWRETPNPEIPFQRLFSNCRTDVIDMNVKDIVFVGARAGRVSLLPSPITTRHGRLRARSPHRAGDRTLSRDRDRDRPRAPSPSLFAPRRPSPSKTRPSRTSRSRFKSPLWLTRPPPLLPSRRMGSPHLSTGTRPLAPPRPPFRTAELCGFESRGRRSRLPSRLLRETFKSPSSLRRAIPPRASSAARGERFLGGEGDTYAARGG